MRYVPASLSRISKGYPSWPRDTHAPSRYQAQRPWQTQASCALADDLPPCPTQSRATSSRTRQTRCAARPQSLYAARASRFYRATIRWRLQAMLTNLRIQTTYEIRIRFCRQTLKTLTAHHVTIRRRQQHGVNAKHLVDTHNSRRQHGSRIHASRRNQRLAWRTTQKIAVEQVIKFASNRLAVLLGQVSALTSELELCPDTRYVSAVL